MIGYNASFGSQNNLAELHPIGMLTFIVLNLDVIPLACLKKVIPK